MKILCSLCNIAIASIYRVSKKIAYKINMMVCHIIMNKIYAGTCVRKFKLRQLEGDNCRFGWGEKNDIDSGVNMIFITKHYYIAENDQNSFHSPQCSFHNVGT